MFTIGSIDARAEKNKNDETCCRKVFIGGIGGGSVALEPLCRPREGARSGSGLGWSQPARSKPTSSPEQPWGGRRVGRAVWSSGTPSRSEGRALAPPRIGDHPGMMAHPVAKSKRLAKVARNIWGYTRR